MRGDGAGGGGNGCAGPMGEGERGRGGGAAVAAMPVPVPARPSATSSIDNSPVSVGFAPTNQAFSTELIRTTSCTSSAYGSQGQMLDGIPGATSLDGFDNLLDPSPAQPRGARRDAALRRAGGGGAAPPPREGGVARPSASHNPFSFSGVSNKTVLLSRKTNSYARRRWLHANSLRAYADKAATAHRVTDLLEHQWTSLSEPAVLPLTTEPMPEPLLRKHHAKDEISMWTVAVPKQRELSGLTPYDKAMSVQVGSL